MGRRGAKYFVRNGVPFPLHAQNSPFCVHRASIVVYWQVPIHRKGSEDVNKRQLQYQTTRDALYDAVNSLVEEMDFDAIRIQDICARAGISMGTFYHYFQNKEDLLIDRYFRSNRHFTALYEARLRDMHPVDALGLLLEELAQYTLTRLPDILVSYYAALVKNRAKWNEREPNALGVIAGRLVRDGLASGQIRAGYTAEEIESFLDILFTGMVSAACGTRGDFLRQEGALRAARDWIEGLRG